MRLSSKNILVIGDVMLDRYWSGNTERISPESPAPIVHIRDSEDKPGGAANVALNLAALGMRVSLIGLVGDDEAGRSLNQAVDRVGIETQLVSSATHPTITKLRVLSRHQQLMRLDNEERFDGSQAAELLHAARERLENIDLLLISDYAKGTLVGVLPALITQARAVGIPVLVDPKGNDFSVYHGATLLTPNRGEFEQIVGDCANEAQRAAAAENLMAHLSLDALLLTRSEEGMSLYEPGHPPHHLSAQVREVFDVTGAGDTVIATLAACAANGHSLQTAASAANIAAGIVVGKLGAASVTAEELLHAMHCENTGIIESQKIAASAEALRPKIAALKAAGKRIVFTNGCFDILHAGHVRYLQEARALGDHLIIAVNSDSSVRRLKGDERPVNSLDARVEVMAALACVDSVLAFDEDTPVNVIETLLPDVLVKGGDWAIDAIVGSDVVLTNGGAVKSLPFADGYSTTAVIEKIKSKDNA